MIDDARWFPDKGAPFLCVLASWPVVMARFGSEPRFKPEPM